MEERQVVVVGGGPAGGETARILAEGGIDTLILEQKKFIGEPVQCAGLISPNAYKIAGSPSTVLNKIRGGRIYSPGGKTLTLRSNGEKALVIDRTEFDRGIIARARDAGASVYTGARVVKIEHREDSFKIKYMKEGEEKECLAGYLVGADGSGSTVRKELDLSEPREILYGYGSHGQGADIGPDELAIILGGDIAPGLFAWIIPEGGGGGARVGLCVSSDMVAEGNSPARYYRKLLSHPVAGRILADYRAEKYISGKICLGLLDRCIKGRCALIGDSAAMAKPISGGGIYPALIAARNLAEVIMKDVLKDNTAEDALEAYQSFIDREMRPDINMAMTAREIYKKLPSKTIDRAFEILNTEKVLEYIVTNGDIDHPLDIATGVFFRAPKLGLLCFSLLSSSFG